MSLSSGATGFGGKIIGDMSSSLIFVAVVASDARLRI